MAEHKISLRDRVENLVARSILGGALLLPYRTRVAFVGKAVQHLVAPLAGWRRRIRSNLTHVLPDLTTAEREKIVRKVSDNVGRTLIEIYSGEEFVAHAKPSQIEGPGVASLEKARTDGKPVVLVTAHMGNYDAVRGKLTREGYPMAALYRPMKNPAFHKHYLKAISTIAEPVYPTNNKGLAALIRHLKQGGIIGIVADVGSRTAPLLSFFGKPAHTPLSAAEWALKYDAALIPIVGIRSEDGFGFRIHVCAEIARSTPEQMMQTYNDEIERIIRTHPEQWFWIHRRWKLSEKAISAGARPPE